VSDCSGNVAPTSSNTAAASGITQSFDTTDVLAYPPPYIEADDTIADFRLADILPDDANASGGLKPRGWPDSSTGADRC
jgi:hypothetical protein